MKTSIKKISEMTGFSSATVSNALNHKPGVNQVTTDTIVRAAQSIGYVTKNTDIRKIKFITYKNNGLIINHNQFFQEVIEGVERYAKKLSYETVFYDLSRSSEDFTEQLESVLSDSTSGIILLGTEMMEQDYRMFSQYRGPVVVLDGWCETMEFDSVLINNADSARMAVEYLLRNGHREIGYLRGSYRINAFENRSLGYRRALAKGGVPLREKYTVTIGTSIESAYQDMKAYLETGCELPTAYFADNDLIAIGAMRALQDKGYSIPGDVSVIGFDDVSFGGITNPRLDTIHVFKREMGEIAVRQLHSQIRHQSPVKMRIEVSTEFIVRDSVRDLNKTKLGE